MRLVHEHEQVGRRIEDLREKVQELGLSRDDPVLRGLRQSCRHRLKVLHGERKLGGGFRAGRPQPAAAGTRR